MLGVPKKMKITSKELLELMKVSDTINYWVKEYQSKNNELNCFKEEYSCYYLIITTMKKINAELMLENKDLKEKVNYMEIYIASQKGV